MFSNKRTLQSPESDIKSPKMSKPEESEELIAEIFKKPAPENGDLMFIMKHIWKTVCSTNNTVSSIEARVKKVETLVDSTVEDITKINKDLSVMKVNNDAKFVMLQNQITDNSRSINGILQNELENDVVIYGFKSKPILETAVPNFLALCDVSLDLLKYSFVQTDPVFGKSRIILSFHNKQSKIKVMQHVISNGPPFLNQLDPGIAETDSYKLQVANNLSRFNKSVRSSLLGLRKSKCISQLRFRHKFFQVKINAESEWVNVDNNITLQEIMELKDQASSTNL